METNIALPQFEEARLRVADFTSRTGRELGIVLDPVKGIIDTVEGDEHNVNFEGAASLRNRWIVHSHPTMSALSMDDILVFSSQGSEGITAVGSDGSVYNATDSALHPYLAGYLQELQRRFMYLGFLVRRDYGWNESEAAFAASHAMNLKVSGQGLYKYDYELSDYAKEVWAKWEGIVASKRGELGYGN